MLSCCCFTGHRQIPAAVCAALPLHIDAALTAFYREGVRCFLAGGAMGFDTLAAERTILFRRTHPDVCLALLLPCRDQARAWPAPARARYEAILAEADSHHYIRDAYDARVMQDRNMALIHRADACIAYMTNPRSGTGQTVRAAIRAGLTVINLANRFPSRETQ